MPFVNFPFIRQMFAVPSNFFVYTSDFVDISSTKVSNLSACEIPEKTTKPGVSSILRISYPSDSVAFFIQIIHTGSRSRIKLGIVVVIHFVVSNTNLVPTIDAPVQSVPWVLKSKVKRKPPFKILEKTSKPGVPSIPHSFFRQIFVCTRRISSWTLLISSVFSVFGRAQLASCHPNRR